jgi:hypothetical protein
MSERSHVEQRFLVVGIEQRFVVLRFEFEIVGQLIVEQCLLLSELVRRAFVDCQAAPLVLLSASARAWSIAPGFVGHLGYFSAIRRGRSLIRRCSRNESPKTDS